MLIRRARPSDAPAICSLHVAAIREVCSAVYDARQIEGWAATKRPERYLAQIESEPFFVAESDGELAGFALLGTATSEVRAVFVRPAWLKRGVGRTLLATLERDARHLGWTQLVLRASLNAVGFYEANGFVAGARASIRFGPDVELDCVFMRKSLIVAEAEAR
jgi:N-acetylglutamate synthase-like GNAT family acetyltransferase